jgi:hypothetical protein
MKPQEIIVYRNPGEKAIWDFLGSADAFIFGVSIVVAFSVIYLFMLANNRWRFVPYRWVEAATVVVFLASLIITFALM